MAREVPIGAFVEYKRALAYPVVRAIEFDGRLVALRSTPTVKKTPEAIKYTIEENGTQYVIRFEPGRGRWVLVSVEDARTDFPPPRCFAPPTWRA